MRRSWLTIAVSSVCPNSTNAHDEPAEFIKTLSASYTALMPKFTSNLEIEAVSESYTDEGVPSNKIQSVYSSSQSRFKFMQKPDHYPKRITTGGPEGIYTISIASQAGPAKIISVTSYSSMQFHAACRADDGVCVQLAENDLSFLDSYTLPDLKIERITRENFNGTPAVCVNIYRTVKNGVHETDYFDPARQLISLGVRRVFDSKPDTVIVGMVTYLPGKECIPARWDQYKIDSKTGRRTPLRSVTITKYEKNTRPDSDFAFAEYGLPEPSGANYARPTPTYVWLILAATVAGGAAVLFRWLQRRAASAKA